MEADIAVKARDLMLEEIGVTSAADVTSSGNAGREKETKVENENGNESAGSPSADSTTVAKPTAKKLSASEKPSLSHHLQTLATDIITPIKHDMKQELQKTLHKDLNEVLHSNLHDSLSNKFEQKYREMAESTRRDVASIGSNLQRRTEKCAKLLEESTGRRIGEVEGRMETRMKEEGRGLREGMKNEFSVLLRERIVGLEEKLHNAKRVEKAEEQKEMKLHLAGELRSLAKQFGNNLEGVGESLAKEIEGRVKGNEAKIAKLLLEKMRKCDDNKKCVLERLDSDFKVMEKHLRIAGSGNAKVECMVAKLSRGVVKLCQVLGLFPALRMGCGGKAVAVSPGLESEAEAEGEAHNVNAVSQRQNAVSRNNSGTHDRDSRYRSSSPTVGFGGNPIGFQTPNLISNGPKAFYSTRPQSARLLRNAAEPFGHSANFKLPVPPYTDRLNPHSGNGNHSVPINVMAAISNGGNGTSNNPLLTQTIHNNVIRNLSSPNSLNQTLTGNAHTGQLHTQALAHSHLQSQIENVEHDGGDVIDVDINCLRYEDICNTLVSRLDRTWKRLLMAQQQNQSMSSPQHGQYQEHNFHSPSGVPSPKTFFDLLQRKADYSVLRLLQMSHEHMDGEVERLSGDVRAVYGFLMSGGGGMGVGGLMQPPPVASVAAITQGAQIPTGQTQENVSPTEQPAQQQAQAVGQNPAQPSYPTLLQCQGLSQPPTASASAGQPGQLPVMTSFGPLFRPQVLGVGGGAVGSVHRNSFGMLQLQGSVQQLQQQQQMAMQQGQHHGHPGASNVPNVSSLVPNVSSLGHKAGSPMVPAPTTIHQPSGGFQSQKCHGHAAHGEGSHNQGPQGPHVEGMKPEPPPPGAPGENTKRSVVKHNFRNVVSKVVTRR